MAEKEVKYKRKWGDRKDGRWLKSLDPYYSLIPYIMKKKSDASNFLGGQLEITEAEKFLRQKRKEGYAGLGVLHLLIAAYIRVVSQRPAVNRFISGQRIYARNNIEIIMSIKRSMSSESGESSIKVEFAPTDTIIDVYNKINDAVEGIKADEQNGTDNTAAALMKLPRLLLKAGVSILNTIDYFGGLPKSLVNVSPFHGSMVVTDIASLGIPTLHHHLYDFGNVPVFLAFGAKQTKYEIQRDGSVAQKRYIEYGITMDERICDGFYFAASLKFLKYYIANPEELMRAPEKVVEDLPR